MAKNTAFAAIDAQNARIESMETTLQGILKALTGQAPPVVAPQVAPEPTPPAVEAALDAKADREYRQRRTGPKVDDSVIETSVQDRDRAGNPIIQIVDGVEKPKMKKMKRRLEDGTRVILRNAMLTEFSGSVLGMLTPAQLQILADAGDPVAQPYQMPMHTSKDTGNIGFGSTKSMTFFKTDKHGNSFEFEVAAGVFAMCQRAYLV